MVRRVVTSRVGTILFAVIVAFVVRLFLVQTYEIPSESMLPSLEVGDRLVVEKVSHRLLGVGRGDIVVFRDADDDHNVIKRVIGLPGEVVESIDGRVLVNGEPSRSRTSSASPHMVWIASPSRQGTSSCSATTGWPPATAVRSDRSTCHSWWARLVCASGHSAASGPHDGQRDGPMGQM